jgi:putative flippase GtrA
MKKFFKPFLEEIRGEYLTIGKFILVGTWNTIFGYSIYYIVLKVIEAFSTSTNMAYLWAMGAAQVIGTIIAYISHKKITFSERVSGNRIAEFSKFSLVYILSFCLALILMPYFVEVLRVKAEISGIIVICIGTIISYLGHSRFSFTSK